MNEPMNETKVLQAISFAMEKHSKQVRKASGMPYIVHLHGTALLLRAFKESKNLTDLVCAGYLHDVLEDTDCTHGELQDVFGPLVASIVREVTNNKEEIEGVHGGNKCLYLIEKMLSMSSYALTLKLCDRLDNVASQPTKVTETETRLIVKQLLFLRKLSTTQKAIIQRIQQVVGDT
jgi:(p)ppGpp synthase/HD superfamily hydrolase